MKNSKYNIFKKKSITGVPNNSLQVPSEIDVEDFLPKSPFFI